jgi:3(or 17)beta-hydroxysteroid dehydrogenase
LTALTFRQSASVVVSILPRTAIPALLTKSAALHCARAGYGIRVNSVHPSFAETPMVLEGIARAKDPERVRAGLMRAAPMRRMGTADEVANMILFLASDESSFTTGAEFMVDGGLTAQ